MSLLFSRINEFTYEDQSTFDLSSDLYTVLIGDQNMPISPSGALPAAVEVPLSIVAALLYEAKVITLNEVKAGNLTKHDLKFWKTEHGVKAFPLP